MQAHNEIYEIFGTVQFVGLVVIGIAGGLIGSIYNLIVQQVDRPTPIPPLNATMLFTTAKCSPPLPHAPPPSPSPPPRSLPLLSPPSPSPRQPTSQRPPSSLQGMRLRSQVHSRGTRGKFTRALETLVLSFICFTIVYWLPVALSCTACPESGSGSGSGSFFDHGCVYEGHHPHVRHSCPEGEYSELATLLLAGQEATMNHLLSRYEHAAETFSVSTLAIFLCLFFCLAVATFGIALPSGNFVPAIVLGGALGRLIGLAGYQAGITQGWTPGAYALLGAASVLRPASERPTPTPHPVPPIPSPTPPSEPSPPFPGLSNSCRLSRSRLDLSTCIFSSHPSILAYAHSPSHPTLPPQRAPSQWHDADDPDARCHPSRGCRRRPVAAIAHGGAHHLTPCG